jgi:hypothetical protein
VKVLCGVWGREWNAPFIPAAGTGWRLLALPPLFVLWERPTGSNPISRVTPSQSRRGFKRKSRDLSGNRCSVRLTPTEQSYSRCDTAKHTALRFQQRDLLGKDEELCDPLDRLAAREKTSQQNSHACDAHWCERRPDSLAFILTPQLRSRYNDYVRRWTVRWSNSRKGEICCTRLTRTWGPAILLFNG